MPLYSPPPIGGDKRGGEHMICLYSLSETITRRYHMPSPLIAILLAANQVAKEKVTSENICPGCGERHLLIKWGFYNRYLFHGQEMIRIQRFRCLNNRCPRRTFSILPHPFLPIVRLPLCFIMSLLAMHQDNCPMAELARQSAKSWSVVRRTLVVAKRIQTVLKTELESLLPCFDPAASWTVFTHAFSWALFPRRF